MDNLSWWLQPEIRQDVEKRKANTRQWPIAEEYFKELRDAGVSEEYIHKEMEAISVEQESAEEDTMEIIKGPES